DLPIPAFVVRTVLDGIYRGSEPIPIQTLKNRSVTAFAGIAKPDRFFEVLESLGLGLSNRVRFRDHHRYSSQDLESLPGEVHITTEKDAVRLKGVSSVVRGDFL